MSTEPTAQKTNPKPASGTGIEVLRRVAQLSARLLEMPFVVASGITEGGAAITVTHGFEGAEVIQWPFAQVIATTVLPDLRVSSRFKQHPAVMGTPGIRFYAAAPMRTHDGFSLGTLCVMDARPRPDFGTAQQLLLGELAAMVAAQFELSTALARTGTIELRAKERLETGRRETKAAFDRAVSSAKLGLVTFDGAGRVTMALGRLLTDVGLEASVGRTLDELHAAPGLSLTVRRALEGQTGQLEMRSRAREGVRLELRVTPLTDHLGHSDGAVAVISPLNEASSEGNHAFLDPLTGLPGRVLMLDRLEQLLSQSGRNARPLALMMIELEGLEDVAQTLGETAFETIIQEVSKRLRSGLRGSDTVARWGFAEFAAILPGLRDANAASKIINKLMKALDKPFKFERHALVIGARAGLSFYPTDGESTQTLLSSAEAELRRTFDDGERVRLRDPAQHAQPNDELGVALEGALEREEFFLEFQPQFDLRSNAVVTFEALLRWRHPVLGALKPEYFLSSAEAQGLIAPIGAWVLGEALRQAKSWPVPAGTSAPRVAVNVAPLQFGRTDFVSTVARALERAEFEPARLELELTESILMHHPETASRHVTALNALNVRIAIDDFGHDAFSLGFLQRLRVNTFKIDRAFVREIEFASSATPLLTAIVGMAREMKLEVVAKGVETEPQAHLLRELGCDRAQGFFYSAPLLAVDVPTFLNEQTMTEEHPKT